MEVLVGILLACAFAATTLRKTVSLNAALSTAGTVFCGVFVQAVPFLVLGVVVSGLVAAFATPDRLARGLPRRAGGGVLASGGATLTFMLSAPAINPVVLVATSVAFPGEPRMVVARLIGSLLTAVVMGELWLRLGRADWVTRQLPKTHDDNASRWTVFTEAARHDFLTA